MTDERRPSAAYYRQVAAEIGQLASKAQFPEIRLELLQIAERFSRMAEFVESRRPNQPATVPPQTDRDET